MSNVHHIDERDRVLKRACEWIVVCDGELSEAQREALKRWLAERPIHTETFLRVAEVWDKMDSLSRLADLFPEPVQSTRSGWPHWAAAALVAGAALGIGVFSAMFAGSDTTADQTAATPIEIERRYETNPGEQSNIHLPDGSRLILNTDSLIAAVFDDDQRTIFLDRGEVHIEVEYDAARPFSVVVSDTLVQAAGTAFNIELTLEQHIELIVTEGKVLVGANQSNASSPSAAHPIPAIPSGAIPVEAGEQVLLQGSDEVDRHVMPISNEDIEARLSWRGGMLVFRGESLATAIAEIERYTLTEFDITDEQLANARVVGIFKAGDVEGLLSTLERNLGVAYRRAGDGRIVLSSAPNAPPDRNDQ